MLQQRKRKECEKLKIDNSREAWVKKKHERAIQALRQKRYHERKKAKKESSTKQQTQEENSLELNVQIVDNDGSREAYYCQCRVVKRATQSQQKTSYQKEGLGKKSNTKEEKYIG